MDYDYYCIPISFQLSHPNTLGYIWVHDISKRQTEFHWYKVQGTCGPCKHPTLSLYCVLLMHFFIMSIRKVTLCQFKLKLFTLCLSEITITPNDVIRVISDCAQRPLIKSLCYNLGHRVYETWSFKRSLANDAIELHYVTCRNQFFQSLKSRYLVHCCFNLNLF